MNLVFKRIPLLAMMMGFSIAHAAPGNPFAFVTRYVLPFVDRLDRYHPKHLLPPLFREQLNKYRLLIILVPLFPYAIDLVKATRTKLNDKIFKKDSAHDNDSL